MAGAVKGIWVKTVSKSGTKTRFLNNRDKGGISHGDTITLSEYNKLREGQKLSAPQAVSTLKDFVAQGNSVSTPGNTQVDGAKTNTAKTRLSFALKINEDRIAHGLTETAIAFDKDGNLLFSKGGTKNAVNFTPQELTKLKGAVATHNHPAQAGADSYGLDMKNPQHKALHKEMIKAGHDIGISFSADDIALLSVRKMAEIRAVTPNYTYSMKAPKDGWNNLDWNKDIMPVYEKHAKRLNESMIKGFNDGTIANKGEAAIKLNHFVWKAVAKETGMEYSVEKIARAKS